MLFGVKFVLSREDDIHELNPNVVEAIEYTGDCRPEKLDPYMWRRKKPLRLQEFHCPSSVSKIWSDTFDGFTCLTKFVLKEDSMLRKIGDRAFRGCSIRDFAIAKHLDITECDLQGILALGVNYSDNFVIESGLLMSIDKKRLVGVFADRAVIPSCVEIIHPGAFHSKLEEVSFENGSNICTIDSKAFKGGFIEKLCLNANFNDISGISCDFIGRVDFEVGNPCFEVFDEFILSTDSFILWKYLGSCKEVVIPCYVREIGARCFHGNGNIESVIFEEGSEVVRFGVEAFAQSSIVSISLPDSLEVVAGKCFNECKSLRNVLISEESNLKRIENECFNNCGSLTEIKVPNSLITIGETSFYSSGLKDISFGSANLEELSSSAFCCSKLVRILIPRSVVKIAAGCFLGCEELVDVSFEDGIKLRKLAWQSFYSCSIKTICIPRSVRQIMPDCFRECKMLETVLFEEGSELEFIGHAAFENTVIVKICIPKSVMSIEAESFKSCKKLREVRFEKGSVIKNLNNIFGGETRDVDIVIPKSVELLNSVILTHISQLEFESGSRFSVTGNTVCDRNGSVFGIFGTELPNGEFMIPARMIVKVNMLKGDQRIRFVVFDNGWNGDSLAEAMFSETLLEKIVIPRSVRRIEKLCFASCKKLKSVEFAPGSELKTICESAFNDSKLEKIIIPRSVEEIGNGAFSWCNSLMCVAFESESTLKRIGARAFSKTKIGTIVIPDSVVEIGDECFDNSSSLTRFIVGEKSQLETFGENVFKGCFIRSLFIPSRVANIAGDSLVMISDLVVSPENPNFVVSDQLLMSHDHTRLYGYFGGLSSVIIPKSVRIIERKCFLGMKKIASVEFEEGSELEIVREKAFSETSIKRIEFPRKLKHIEERCLRDCRKLKHISFHEDCPLEEIPYIFDGSDFVLYISSNVSKINRHLLSRVEELNISEKNSCLSMHDKVVCARSDLLGVFGGPDKIIIPKFVTRIAKETFSGSDVKFVGFEEGSQLTEIGESAFWLDQSLKCVSFENVSGLKKINRMAFFWCNNLSIEIPRSVDYISGSAFVCVGDVSVQEGNTHFCVYNGFLMNSQMTTCLNVRQTESEELVLPREVRTIGESCFSWFPMVRRFQCQEGSELETIEEGAFNRSQLLEMHVPSTVSKMGRKCFYKCSLREIVFEFPSKLSVFEEAAFRKCRLVSITIPASVKKLGNSCFMKARKLKSVSFEDSPSLVCIRENCFRECESLVSIELEKCANLQYIFCDAFTGTKLTKVTLHSNLHFISERAFDNTCKIEVIKDFENNEILEWVSQQNENVVENVEFDVKVETRDVDSDDDDFEDGFWESTDDEDCGDLLENGFMKERNEDFYLASDFVRVKTLGKGAFGEVYLIENQFTSEKYAVKELFGARSDEFEREKTLMKSLVHRCLVSLIGFHLVSPVSLCMEYVDGGTLEEAISCNPEWFDATCRAKIVVGVACGMSFIHSRNAIHRDLKPSNILLDSSHEAKISDFGTARFEGDREMTMNVGSPLYMAPEMHEGVCEFPQKVDVFSFGLILYEVIEGHAAFCRDLSVNELRRQVCGGIRPGFTKALDSVSSIIECCWDANPDMRPSFDEILYEFEEELGFNIIEGADCSAVREYFRKLRHT